MFIYLRYNDAFLESVTASTSAVSLRNIVTILGNIWCLQYQRSPSADYLHSLPRDHCVVTMGPGGDQTPVCQVEAEDNEIKM